MSVPPTSKPMPHEQEWTDTNQRWHVPASVPTPIPQPVVSTRLMSKPVNYGAVSGPLSTQQVAARVLTPSSQRPRHYSLPTGHSEYKSPNHNRETTPMPRPVSLLPTMRATHPRSRLPAGAPMHEETH